MEGLKDYKFMLIIKSEVLNKILFGICQQKTAITST